MEKGIHFLHIELLEESNQCSQFPSKIPEIYITAHF